MAGGAEEVEIKIEYNESLETDPLLNIEANVAEENEFDDVTSSGNIQVETEHNFIPDPSDDIEDFTNCEVYTGVENREMIIENKATWYKEIDSSGRFLCRFCDLNYSTVQTLRHHIKMKHPDDAKQLKSHILNNKRNSKLKCHICKARFKIIAELKDHVKQKHSLENIEASCTHCDATFANRKDMLQHLFYEHKVVIKQIFSCMICGYRTMKKSHYNQHRNTHSKQKDMKCEHCDYSTNYLPNLKIHERIHTNVRPYVCNNEGCDYSCSAKSALRSHQLKHNREQNMLYCHKCTYSTVYKQSLKKHIESHKRNSNKMKS